MLRAFALAAVLAAVPAHHPSQPRPIDGIRCEGMEGAVVHIHQFLALYDRGRRVPVPAGIGIPQRGDCQYWLHTHTADGLIHDEVPVRRFFTLGEFFDVWGAELDPYRAGPLFARPGTRLRFVVDGKRFTGNPRAIRLYNHTEIVIKSGPPYFSRTRHYDWGDMG